MPFAFTPVGLSFLTTPTAWCDSQGMTQNVGNEPTGRGFPERKPQEMVFLAVIRTRSLRRTSKTRPKKGEAPQQQTPSRPFPLVLSVLRGPRAN